MTNTKFHLFISVFCITIIALTGISLAEGYGVSVCGGESKSCACGGCNYCWCCDGSGCTNGGNCVWLTWNERCKDGEYLPWCTNADTWDDYARSNGWPVCDEPRVGAVGVMSTSWVGHVGYVVEISGNQVRCKEQGCGGCGTHYYWRDKSEWDLGYIWFKNDSCSPAPNAPNPSIQWLDQGVNSADGQKVKVTCSLPANATQLYYDMSGSGANDYGWTGNTSYTDSGIADSQTVQVRCKARGPGGDSSYSSWKSVSIGDRTAPSTPNPSIEWLDAGLNSGDTQEVRVSCSLPSGATQLYYDMSGTGTDDYGWTANTSYTDSGVADSQTVSCTVKARDSAGNWSSTSANVTVGDRTAPAAPSPVIEWLDAGLNSADTQEIRVSCPLPAGAMELSYELDGTGCENHDWTTATSYTDSGVADEQTVQARCRARDSEGNTGSFSGWESVAVGDRTAPAQPGITQDWSVPLEQPAGEPSINPYPLKGTRSADTTEIWLNGVRADASFTGATTWETLVALHDGNNQVSVTAKDAEGNYTETAVTAQITVDIAEWFIDDDVPDRADGYPLDGFTPQTAFRTIAEGHATAGSGDLLRLMAGHYAGPVQMKAGVPILGEGRDIVTIDGEGTHTVITGAPGTVIAGVTVKKSGNLHGGCGIYFNGDDFTVEECAITDNHNGIKCAGASHVSIANTLIWNNRHDGILSLESALTLTNNTIDGNARNGVTLSGPGVVTASNNILSNNHRGISSDRAVVGESYNLCWGNGGGNYHAITPGTGSFSACPRYRNRQGGDFHLLQDSPGIDRGDPADSFSIEPAPNGGRINLGAYGNTAEAASAGTPTDSDGDGIPDWWETMQGLNPSDPADSGGVRQEVLLYLTTMGIATPPGFIPANHPFTGTNSATDPDNDDLTNLEEYLTGNNPSEYHPPSSWDSDGDGLQDFREIDNGLNPHSGWGIQGASGDFDGDGVPNGDEYRAATDPADSSSFFAMTTVDRTSPGTVTLTWSSVDSLAYDIYVSEKPLSDHTVWSVVVTDFASTGSETSWTDDGTHTGSPPTETRNYMIAVSGSPTPCIFSGEIVPSRELRGTSFVIGGVSITMGSGERHSPGQELRDLIGDRVGASAEGTHYCLTAGTLRVNLSDNDGDGLLDSEEQSIHGTDCEDPDTDGDGMIDGWECRYYNPPAWISPDPNAADAHADPDNDGASNLEEYLAWTDPTDAGSVPPTPTATVTPTRSMTPTPSPSPTRTPLPTCSPTPTPTRSPSPTPTVTLTPTISPTPAPPQLDLIVLMHGLYNPADPGRSTAISGDYALTVELRDTFDGSGSNYRYYDIALDAYGAIEGGALTLSTLVPGAYYVVVAQLNHLAAISNDTVDFDCGTVTTVNLSDPASPHYVPVHRGRSYEETDGMRTLHGGNGDTAAGQDLYINVRDAFVWMQANGTSPGMPDWNSHADFDANGLVNVLDALIWTRCSGAFCEVSIAPLTITITSPLDESESGDVRVTVTGSINDNNAVIDVNGVPASVTGGTFTAPDVPLPVVGSNTITATAGDLGNAIAVDTITVIRVQR